MPMTAGSRGRGRNAPYRWYLGMKICDANGETTKYANEAAKYNSYYQGYFNAYNQAYMPKQYATHFKL